MADVTPSYGPVEAAVRVMVAEMGPLPARQQVAAAAAYRLAGLLDAEEDGSRAASLDRALRHRVAELTPAVMPVPARTDDAITRLQDELAKRRRGREQGA